MASTDVVIIGAGASGLMCAIEAGKHGRGVIVLDHATTVGAKILMSGGGRCNFTNRTIEPSSYISDNPHFCKSALSRFTQWDFLGLVEKHGIPYCERDHGRLFCRDSARDIVTMLLAECASAGVEIFLNVRVDAVAPIPGGGFHVTTAREGLTCSSLVVATGGLSIPASGASPLGYRIAQQLGINVIPTRPGLVPLTLQKEDRDVLSKLAGISVPCVVSTGTRSFTDDLLITHRGLSGPAILQISSYWRPGEEIIVNLLPHVDLVEELSSRRAHRSKSKVKTVLEGFLPGRLLGALLGPEELDRPVLDTSDRELRQIADRLYRWVVRPGGTEGNRTAEITCGGVDCNAVSSRTMASTLLPGLHFVGEVLDVTGWLGGYNFQWAWSSGWCAGQHV
jgi:predicted Rossmann fold flavoprotein